MSTAERCLTHYPYVIMTLYRVRMQYAFNIQAWSQEEAYRLVCKAIREHPETAISGVEDARYANHRPLWKRLLTGR